MSDFNYRGKLPFRIVSSSVNTGYNAELTAAVGYNIEIVDQHRDEYGGLQDSPVQGPFTEQWVGGNQHRHVDLNTGNDDPNKRPEAFIVSGSSGKVRIYGPTHFDINAPKALLTRDNVAKSPVNIKNIRDENRRLGNFSKNYQVVQTSGRDINQSLIQNSLTASGVLTTKFIKNIETPIFIENFILSGSLATNIDDHFGTSVSQNSAGNIIVVGSPADKSGSNAANSGVTYVFEKTNLGFFEKSLLTGSLAIDNGDSFGTSVSLNSAGNVLAVGAIGDKKGSNGTSSGVVYIFSSGSNGFIEIQNLTGSLATDANDFFGWSVSLNSVGDVLAVGAIGDQSGSNGASSGISYIFKSGSSGFTEIARLTGSLALDADDYFGVSVSFNSSGDIFAAGAVGDLAGSNGISSGVAYIFISSSGGYQETQRLTGSFATEFIDSFAWSVALNSDGDILAVGSIFDESISANSGSGVVYVFKDTSGTFKEIQVLKSSLSTTAGDRFGSSIALNSSGNILAISAPNDLPPRVYIFNSGSTGYIETHNFTGSLATDADDYFGSSLSFDSSGEQLVIGAPYDEKISSGIDSGLVYVFSKSILNTKTGPYTLPNITDDNKTVFVERFNAPGGINESSRGALDRASEQYSPNNSLVTRNIKVRQPYYSQLTQHAAQFNSGSTEGVTLHAVNRNTIKNIELSGATYVTASDYDNFWVQHAIPSTDLRYKWIADSVVSFQEPIQYQKLYDSTELVFNSASLVTNGSNKQFQVDNIGINSVIKNKKTINIDTNTFLINNPSISASFSEICNTPYQYSAWKQIRTGEHPVARKLRENNIISIEGEKTVINNNQSVSARRSNNVIQYTEPPVTIKHKPIIQDLQLKNTPEIFKFKFTHENNFSTFVNKELVNKLGMNEETEQLYDLLKKYYSHPNRATDVQNPILQLAKMRFSETVYPREVNTYLAETRGRTQYILDQAGTGSRDGYDIQLGTQRSFWRNKPENRRRSNSGFYNSMNYFITQSSSLYKTDYAWGWNPDLNIGDPFGPPLMSYQLYKENYYYAKNPLDSFKLVDNNLGNVRKNLGDVRTIINFATSSGNNIIAALIIDNGCNGELNGEIFFDYYYTSSIQPIFCQLTRVTDMSVLLQFDNGITGSYGTVSSILGLAKKPRVNYTAFLGGFESGSRNRGSSLPASEIYDYDFYTTNPGGPILSTLDSGLRYASESFGDKKPWFDSYEDYSDDIRSYAKDHSILSEFRISSHMPFYVTENGGNFRTKNSSFLEIDGIGQNYRSSQTASNFLYDSSFIDSYVTTDNVDSEKIQRDDSNLKLEKLKFTVSGIKKLLPYNGFYPQERTVQLANLFNDFLDNNVGGGFFRLNGAGDFTELIVDITQSAELFAKNTVMPYYFAPGILYNTIKSGISVDFPAITASYISLPNEEDEVTITKQVQISSLGTASYLAAPINSRISFESLIFPENFIPIKTNASSSFSIFWDNTGTDIEQIFNDSVSDTLLNIKIDCNSKPDRFFGSVGRHWKNTIPFAFLKNNKTVDPSYSMAMSNFLAEIPRFFLKNGTMNVFRSAETKDWKTFEIGKKYYFDLKMKKSSDLVMIEAYSSSYHVAGSTDIEKTFNGRYFGWPVSKTSNARTSYDNLVVHNDPAYAPFTPPYLEGEAVLRFELSASKPVYNSVKELEEDIRVINIFDSLARSMDTGSDAYIHKMSIQDCMKIFGIGQNPITSFNNTNNADNFEQAPNTLKQYWAISPKLETPVLDFSEQSFVPNTGDYWVSSGYGRGMWSGYGKIPTGSKGITIEIAESFPLQTGFRTNLVSDNLKTGSLLQQVGFQAERAKIGQLAETKTISEAIVMIPYVDNSIQGVTTYIDNHHFFAINEGIFGASKQFENTGTPNEMIGRETSVTKMIKQMKNYVIPPRFNFLKYDNIKPFVMYLFEFTHDLDQQDLADIWQGVMPKIAINAEHDVLEFGHKTGQFELFGENFTPPPNMRWMVFKVKKKAEWNYFAITENIGDDQDFKFKFANSQEAKTPDYSYNWPYDYFSLVELSKIDVAYEYTREESTPTINTGNNQFSLGENLASPIVNYGGKTTGKKVTSRRMNKSLKRTKKAAKSFK